MAQKTIPTYGATIHMTQERWEKTPAYARDEIERLSRLLDAAEREVKERRLENAQSRIFVDNHPEEGRIYLAKDATVGFNIGGLGDSLLPKGDEHRREIVQARVARDHAGAQWHVQVMGGDALSIEPWASNVVRIFQRDR